MTDTELEGPVMDCCQTNLVNVVRETEIPRFLGSLLRLVAEGAPVTLDRLAAEEELPVGQVESWLRAQPGTDWDQQGRLLGFGLTQRPTGHRFIVGDRTLFAFCAADTLMFPPMLGRSATVESSCPATGQEIRLKVTPDTVTSVDPATTVVSQVCLGEGTTDIRATVCDHGHFYASNEAAAQWRQDHPDGDIRPVTEFFALTLTDLHGLGLIT